MTPEKRSVEDDDEESTKKVKQNDNDSKNDLVSAVDDSSQDSIASNSSDSEKKRLKLPEDDGTLLFCGCLQWDFIGRRNQKGITSMQHFTPRRLSSMEGIRVAFVAAHCSSAHSVVITTEGKAMAFGRNEKGQLGVGDAVNRTGPVNVESLKDFTVVSAAVGRNHSLFLNDLGSVFACGENKCGQCGIGNTTPVVHTPCMISFKESRIVKVACGAEFSMIVDVRGYLYSFGLPEYGQLGHNTDGKYFVASNKLTFQYETSPRRVPVFLERSKEGHPMPVSDVQIVDVSCGNNHTVAIDSKKRAFSWGFGGYGRLGHAEPKDEHVPRLIKFFDGPNRGVQKAFCGSTFTIGITELGVYLWGQTKRTGEANMYPKPIQDLYGWNVRSIGCSVTSIVLAADDAVISWGPSPTYGELGLGDNTKSSTQAKQVKSLDGAYIVQVACGQGHTLLISRDKEQKDKEILNKLTKINV